jgi:hypothetical protein
LEENMQGLEQNTTIPSANCNGLLAIGVVLGLAVLVALIVLAAGAPATTSP